MSSEHTTADDSTEDAPMPLEQLSREQQQELISAWEGYQDSNDTPNVRRRGFLQAGAALLTGTAIGGGAYALSSEEVAAAANEVGQIGEPGSLVDVYGEDVEAVSVSTPQLSSVKYPDPGEDLSNVFGSGGTLIKLRPGETYTLSSPVPKNNRMILEGSSGQAKASNNAVIEYTGGASPMVDWSGTGPITGSVLRNLSFVDVGGSATHGLDAELMIDGCLVENCGFSGGDTGVRVRNSYWSALHDIEVWSGSGPAFEFGSTAGGRVTTIPATGLIARDADGPGFLIDDVYATLAWPSTSTTIGDSGIKVTGGGSLHCFRPYLERNGRNQSNPIGIEVESGNAWTYGGWCKTEADGYGVRVSDSGAVGVVSGMEFQIVDPNNKPLNHVLSDSPYFDVSRPNRVSPVQNDDFDIEGRVYGGNRQFYTDRKTPTDLSAEEGRGAAEIRFDDGTNTSRSFTACAWDAVNDLWYPLDGSASFSGI